MAGKSHGKSRRKTPWDGKTELTPTQEFLRNLFAFVRNPPYEMLEKVEKIVNLAFQNPKFLRYRDQFGLNQGVET